MFSPKKQRHPSKILNRDIPRIPIIARNYLLLIAATTVTLTILKNEI
jgi:hypothetical protein